MPELINFPTGLKRNPDCAGDPYREEGTLPADTYFTFFVHVIPVIPTLEATDTELIALAEKSGAFLFLADPTEEVYTLEDGVPIE